MGVIKFVRKNVYVYVCVHGRFYQIWYRETLGEGTEKTQLCRKFCVIFWLLHLHKMCFWNIHLFSKIMIPIS